MHVGKSAPSLEHCETDSCGIVKLLSSVEQYKEESPSVLSTAVIGVRHSWSTDSLKFKENSALIGCALPIHGFEYVPDEVPSHTTLHSELQALFL